MKVPIFMIVLVLAISSASIAFFVLVVKALLKYIRSQDVRKHRSELCRSLGEVIKANRTRCKMTQEFVAEALGVSRQAVSKWESGISDPSTSNLLALAKLFGVSAEDLIRQTQE